MIVFECARAQFEIVKERLKGTGTWSWTPIRGQRMLVCAAYTNPLPTPVVVSPFPRDEAPVGVLYELSARERNESLNFARRLDRTLSRP